MIRRGSLLHDTPSDTEAFFFLFLFCPLVHYSISSPGA